MTTEYCEDILNITDFTKLDILKCREVIYNLMTLSKNFKGSPSIMMHLERLLVISKEKYAQLLNYYKEIAKTDTIDKKSKEELKNVAAEKHEELRKSLNIVSEVRATVLSERRSRYNPSQIVDANRQNEVISDAGRAEYILIFISRNSSEMGKKSITSVLSIPDSSMKEVDEALAEEERKKVQKANLKRYFFTLIANAKKVLGPKNMGYYVDSILLFNEAIKRNKSVDDWPAFIMAELNTNPRKWIEPKKLTKIQTMYAYPK